MRLCLTASFPGQEGERTPQTGSQVQRSGANLSLSYELISLPMHIKGSFQTEYRFSSRGHQPCLRASLLEYHWAANLPVVVTSPSGQMGFEGTPYNGWGCDSALAWAWLYSQQNSLFKEPNQVDLLPDFPEQSVPPIQFFRLAKPMVRLPLGSLQIWIQSAKILMPAVVIPSLLCPSQ